MIKTRTKVVIINGTPQSGKDTLVNLATDYCNVNECANILNLSSVDPIKSVLAQFGWDGEKTDEIRDIMAGIKKLWVVAQNGPTMFLMNNILQFHMSHVGEDNIVFCHIREPEEINKLKSIITGMDVVGIDVTTLFIIRDNQPISSITRYSDDPIVISQYSYDNIILNNSDLVEYDYKVCNFIDKLLNEEDK
jgi:hypothetical protein